MSFPDWLAAVVKYLSELQYFIAGLMGAAVATRYNKEQLKTPKDYAVFLLSGAFTAHYLTYSSCITRRSHRVMRAVLAF